MATSSKMSTLKVSNAIRQLTVEETRQLVFQMGVQLKTLDDIAAQYNGENRKQHFVQAWLDIDSNASWDKLVAGLREINKNSLATDVECLTKVPVSSSGSPSLLSISSSISVSAPPPVNTPGHLETATPAPVNPLLLPDQSSTLSQQKVEDTRNAIEHFEDEFSDVKYEAKESLSLKQSEDPKFICKFRDRLLDMPVTKKQVHIRFFSRNEDEILKAETIQKLFNIIGRYCNYSNYEIIFHIVKKFCHHELKGRMVKYRDSLTSFEKSTTVDVYLCAISARPGGEISKGFIHMTMKINKPPSECTLYEIRELKESIEEKASLESYAVYIETPEEGSVCVVLHVYKEVGWMVGVVFSTPDFRQKHLLLDVTIGGQDLMKYLVRCWKLYIVTNESIKVETLSTLRC